MPTSEREKFEVLSLGLDDSEQITVEHVMFSILRELLLRKILENFFGFAPNTYGLGASYDQCIQKLRVRDDFFQYDSSTMHLSNLRNEELLKSVFLFQQNGLEGGRLVLRDQRKITY